MACANPPPFFIAGLPRSRTTWLANFFTTGEVFCHHEPLQHIRAVGDLDLEVPGAVVVGTSDAAIGPIYDRLTQRYPIHKLFIIDREPDACLKSLRHSGIPCDPQSFDVLASLHRKFCDRFPDRVLAFDRLSHLPTLELFWRDAVSDAVPFNAPRAQALLRMNVQPHLPTSLPMWQENVTNLATLMEGALFQEVD